MSRTRIEWMFLGSLVLLVGRAAIAEEPPAAGEAGGQTYGGATYEKAAEPGKVETNITTPAEPAPVVEHKTTVTTPAPIMSVQPIEQETEGRLMTPFGLSLAIGGGVTGFTDDTMDGLTNTGGTWDARLTIGSRLPIALEAAYLGTAQEINALGLDPDATLVSNGVEGALRLNLGTYMVQPFVFAGAGWQRFDLVGANFNTSSVRNEDDIFALPVGAGIATKYRGFLLDARVTYRETWGNDLMTIPSASSDDDDVELNHWMGTARLGFEF